MRLAVMVVGMLVGVWTYVETLQVTRLDVGVSDLGRDGVLSALMCALAAILVFPRPFISMVLFGLAAVTSLVVATQGHDDHYLYGSTMVALAAMSLWAWFGVSKDQQRQHLERARRRETMGTVCPACGYRDRRITRFCVSCGASVTNQTTEV